MKKPLELYVHIPFCVRKCGYCDFLSAPAGPEVQRAYTGQLVREIRVSRALSGRYEVSTVFFGGGTPSILDPALFVRILEELRGQFSFRADAEITMEANPGTVSRDRLGCYRDAGVNRLSFGLQSADNRELGLLGRIHTWETFLESWQMAREAGFSNMNIDLMSALPGQTVEGYRETVKKILMLAPEHISAYSLMIEEGTPFYERYGGHRELLPSEEEERQMYYDTGTLLKAAGYEQYEISNYARPGYACRHNIGYWERTDYKGYGLGAASLLENVRYTNQTELSEYMRGNTAGSEEPLSEQAVREEYFFLGLRMRKGVDPGKYEAHYGALLQKLEDQQLLKRTGGRVCLTDRGIDVSNYVLAQFLD